MGGREREGGEAGWVGGGGGEERERLGTAGYRDV